MQGGSPLSLTEICSNLGLMPDAVLDVSQHSARYYTQFQRPKRNGGVRNISASHGCLKAMQRVFLDGVLAHFSMPDYVHGCVKGRSQVTNARVHINKDVVINIDLIDFVGSVSFDRVSQILMEKFNFDGDAAEIFTRVCISGGGLPQGAPTSPALANIAALPLDETVINACRDLAATSAFQYTRYVDDITISGGMELVALLPHIYEAIEKDGFRPNTKKTRILKQSIRQSVTGVVVNKKVNVPKTLLRKIRQQLYYCHKFGIKEHCENQSISPSRFLKKLHGSISYIRPALPELADELTVSLNTAARDLNESTVERNLNILKDMIDKDQVASFCYPEASDPRQFWEEQCCAAPAGLIVDAEDSLILRAFQLQPEQGWKYYLVSRMRHLEVYTKQEDAATEETD